MVLIEPKTIQYTMCNIYIKGAITMKGMLKIGLILAGFTSLSVANTAEIVERQKEIEAKVDSIRAQQGISFSGEFRGQFMRSQIEGEAVNDQLKSIEDLAYTQADFRLTGRPHSDVSANVIFRMHADWPNFWGSPHNPVAVRWLSIDGTPGDFIKFNVGDMQRRWTPFTIWSNNNDQLFEPDIFAQMREHQMGEVFLGNNSRPLQGVSIRGEISAPPVIDYLGIELLGTRLRTAFLPKFAEGGPKAIAGNLVVTSFESGDMDKLAYGTKLDASLFNSDVFVAALRTQELGLTQNFYPDTLPPEPLVTNNISIGGGVNVDEFLGAENIVIRPYFEYGMSNFYIDTTDNSEVTDGTALLAGIELGYTMSYLFNIALDVSFSNNSKHFRADMAQSPEFIPRAIMNTDNAMEPNEHFTYFDARYHGAWKSMTKNMTNTGISYIPYPTTKLAYTNMILTAEESGIFEPMTADGVRMGVPFLAPLISDPNITGISASLKTGFLDNIVEIEGYARMMSDVENQTIADTANTFTLEKTEYSAFGGGMRLHIGRYINLPNPLRISGAAEMSTANRDGEVAPLATESMLLNGGLYIGLLSRLGLVGGSQLLVVTDETNNINFRDLYNLAGVEYKIDEGARLILQGGRIRHQNDNDGTANFIQSPIIMSKIEVKF